MAEGSPPPALPPGALRAAVRQLLQEPRAEPLAWEASPLAGGASGRPCHRVRGTATCRGGQRPFRLVVQTYARTPASADPRDIAYWCREPLLHASGLLPAGPGLRAPRRLLEERPAADSIRLWVEDVAPGEPWTRERWALAARHLGRFNAARRARGATPPWLGGGRLRALLGRAEPLVARIAAAPDEPALRHWWPPSTVTALLGLWREREAFCGALERLPQGLAHGDAIRRNLFAARAADGNPETVAIDWEVAGSYALGEEVGQSLSVAAAFFDAEPDGLPELDGVLFAGYLDGLRDAGWHGDPLPVRFAFAAHAALRNAFNAVGAVPPDAAARQACLERYGRPWEDLAERRAAIRPFLLARAAEAREFLPRL